MVERVKLPEIRCTHDFRLRVLARVEEEGTSYAQYVTRLINEDISCLQRQDDSGSLTRTEVVGAGKNVAVTITIPDALYQRLDEVRRSKKESVSEQVRRMLLAHYGVRIPEDRELQELVRVNNLLVAIGRNLNQVARKANSGEHVVVSDLLLNNLMDAVDSACAAVKQLQKIWS
ncbi:MAG: plasmid mobilization relaxosome protein MobC [Neisseria sp.]|nr:MAG: plasmid mobilization relaxosome protein MobC [Neisseria sp.]